MGSNSSKAKRHQDAAKYGEIYLKTDRNTYHAGETVTGMIHLHLKQYYPGNQLFLKLKGRENVDFTIEQRIGNSNHNYQYKEKFLLINESIPIKTWRTFYTSLCQFSIPFSFLIPSALPASFYQQGEKFIAFIEYRIEAYLKPTSEADPKLKYKQPLVLLETETANKFLSQVKDTKLETCGCCEQGTAVLKANFEKNIFSPGEKAKVTMKLDTSKTKLQNHEIVFSLRQRLELKFQQKFVHCEFDYSKQKIENNPQEPPKDSWYLIIEIPKLMSEADFQKQFRWGSSSRTDMTHLQNRINVFPTTTKGKLITSLFYLEVACSMDRCCTNKPEIQCPIQIVSQEPKFPIVTFPPDWHPSKLETVNVAFAASQNQGLLGHQNRIMFQNLMVPNSIQ